MPVTKGLSIQSRYFTKAEEVFPGEFDFHIFLYDLDRAIDSHGGNRMLESFCNMDCDTLSGNVKRWAWEIMNQGRLQEEDIEAYHLVEDLRERYPNRPWELPELPCGLRSPKLEVAKDEHIPTPNGIRNFIRMINGGDSEVTS